MIPEWLTLFRMGNQIVCPSDQGWYESDFEKIGLVVEHSIYDGTFMLSFKGQRTTIRRDIVVKAFKVPEDEDGNKDQEVVSIINSSKVIFDNLIRQEYKLKGSLIGSYHLNEQQAYLIRPYVSQSLQSRMNDFPELTAIEKDWIAYQIVRALQNLHTNGFAHGDLKPENILLTDRLQVLITDIAPFKPKYLRRSQPNYFLHFFNYNGSSSYIAPERVVETQPQHSIILTNADIFSAGCILAYLYTGSNVFNFTTIQEYGSGDLSYLSVLDKIKDEKKRHLIRQFLSLDPNLRLQEFGRLDSYYPEWFPKFYDAFYANSVDTLYMERLLQVHDQLVACIPQDIPECSLIYFNILSDVILSSGRVFSLMTLLNHYINLTTKYFDTNMKLTRAVPPLFEIFERKVTIASVFAFYAINSILNSIDKIPAELINYHTAFLIPRLSIVLKHSWAKLFLCNLPYWATSMHRLWPTSYEDLRQDVSICEYLFMNLNDPGFIHGFLKENIKFGKLCSDFQFFATLYTFFLPLLSTTEYFSDIVELLYTFYSNFDEISKLKFHETLADPIFSAIFSHEPTQENVIEIISGYIKILKLDPKPCHIIKIAQSAMRWSNSSRPAISIASNILSQSLPDMYKKFHMASMLIPIDPITITHSKEQNPFRKFDTKLAARSQTTARIPLAKDKSEMAPDEKSLFLSGKKLSNEPIKNIVFEDSYHILVQTGDISMASLKINRGKITIAETFTNTNTITAIAKLSPGNMMFADTEGLYMYNKSNIKQIFKSEAQIKGIRKFNSDTVALFYNNMNVSELRNINDQSVVRRFVTNDSPINCITSFHELPFIATSDVSGGVNIFDTRVELPIFHTSIDGVYKIIPLAKNTIKFAIVSPKTVRIQSLESESSLFDVSGSIQAVCGDGPSIIITSSSGTYSINTIEPTKSYSLQDGQPPARISFNELTKVIILPTNLKRSLHNHSFKVEVATCLDNVICSGDSRGIVNLWTPQFCNY